VLGVTGSFDDHVQNDFPQIVQSPSAEELIGPPSRWSFR
jgi:hypothetical protein